MKLNIFMISEEALTNRMAVKIKINILCLEVKSIENTDFRNIDTDLQFLA